MALGDAQFSFAVDGALVGSAASTLISMDWEAFDIGHLAGTTRWWNGTIKRVLFYPSRLTDAQLQEITA